MSELPLSFDPVVPDKCAGCAFAQGCAAKVGREYAALGKMTASHLQVERRLREFVPPDQFARTVAMDAQMQTMVSDALGVHERTFASGMDACAGYAGACVMPEQFAAQLRIQDTPPTI
ncbi:MAG TPA: hypothetical protein VLF71_06080 [Candidatus Saccharimonadales bacterium]|nr:hypothetical protein [Candidatus Saccharimonadales bacterium]